MRASWLALFVVRRILIGIPLLIVIAIADFCLIHFAPGDPVTALVGGYPVPPSYIRHVRGQYGLDKPFPTQLWRYLRQLARGNLGVSYAQHDTVWNLLVGRMGATLALMATALALAIVIGSAMGIFAAHVRGGFRDAAIQGVALLGFSVPEFWFGQLLILGFAIRLGWLPISGDAPIQGGTGFFVQLPFIVLPALALSMRYVALIARMTRTSLIDVSSADFITAARARGLSEGAILRRHTYKNAAPPVIAVVGFNLGYILAGSVMVETVFSWPGIGRLLYDSIGNRDYPVMTGILLLVSVTVIVANIVTDIVQTLLDPRAAPQ